MRPYEQLNMTLCIGPCCPSMNDYSVGAYEFAFFPSEANSTNKLPLNIRDLLLRIYSNERLTQQSRISKTIKYSPSSLWFTRATARE